MNRRWILTCCVTGWMFVVVSVVAANEIETLLVVGQPIPSNPDYRLSSLRGLSPFNRSVVMNHAGQIVFHGDISPLNRRGGRSGSGLFSIFGGHFQPLVQWNTPFTLMGQEVRLSGNSLTSLNLSENGRVVFDTYSTGAGLVGSGLWETDGHTIRHIAQQYQVVPDSLSPAAFSSFQFPQVNSSGDVVFLAHVSGAATGLFANRGGTLHKIALERELAYGLPGDFYALSSQNDFSIDEMGRTNYTAQSAIPGPRTWHIWRDNQLLVTPGQELPTTGGESGSTKALLSILNAPRFNSSGAYAFIGQVTAVPPRRGSDGICLFSGQDGSLKNVARLGRYVPGAGPNVSFSNFNQININSQGEVTFLASTSGSADSVWAERDDGLHLVARQGDVAPGTGGEQSFGQIYMPQSNQHQQTAFYARTSSLSSQSFLGVWAEDVAGELRLIAAPGMEVEIAPGETRVIRDLISISQNQTFPPPLYFNDRGQVLFEAILNDGSRGIFLSNRVAVPEPVSMALLLFVGIMQTSCWCRALSFR